MQRVSFALPALIDGWTVHAFHIPKGAFLVSSIRLGATELLDRVLTGKSFKRQKYYIDPVMIKGPDRILHFSVIAELSSGTPEAAFACTRGYVSSNLILVRGQWSHRGRQTPAQFTVQELENAGNSHL